MGKFFQELHEKLITDLEFNRADLDRELATWTAKNGDGKELLFGFYRSCLELGEAHYSGEHFGNVSHNERLRTVYKLMFELYVNAKWSRTPVTRKWNDLKMVEASHSRLKLKMTIIPPGGCGYANQFNNQDFDLGLAMKEFPLDYPKCEREGGCGCTVAFEGIRDENGRLVMRK